jgi:hypothetical protein
MDRGEKSSWSISATGQDVVSPQHRFHQDRSFRSIYINSGKLGAGVFLSNGCALSMTQGNESGIHDAERRNPASECS